jgi:ATP-dependent Lon protease
LYQAEVPRAEIAPAYDDGQDDPAANALVASASEQFRGWLMATQLQRASQVQPSQRILDRLPSITHPGVLADMIAQHLPADLADKQRLLETFHVGRRLEMATALLQRQARAA